MSNELGIDLWIKRDDLTGLAMGGNKGRKLEYLMAAAIADGAQVVVTCGAAQSNFIRQLGAACSMLGVKCAAAIMTLPYEVANSTSLVISSNVVSDVSRGRVQHNPALGEDRGNLILDKILGIDLRTHPDGTWEELYEYAEDLAKEYEASGLKTYRIPVGGSSALGAYAFYESVSEVTESFDSVVFASSSGSTHTGLAFGFHESGTQVLGIACDPEPDIASDFAELAKGLKAILPDGPDLSANDYDLNFDFVGPGYGIPSEEGNSAIERLARAEGIFLDPIYSGKAFAALIALTKTGELKGRVLFWHTGGTPTLFA